MSGTPVIAMPGSTGVTINVSDGSSVSAAHTVATQFPVLSVDQMSTINNLGTLSLTGGAGTGTNRGAAILGADNGNMLTNTGTINTTGAFNDGVAANGSNNTLINNGTITTTGPNAYGLTGGWIQTNTGQSGNTLTNTGMVSTSGSNARAASILGGNGIINNSGTLSTTGASSPGAYIQGNNGQLVNSGTIMVSGSQSFGVFSNTVASSFTATINNLPGGEIISQNGAAIRTLNGATTITNAGLLESGVGTAIEGGNGNISLVLQTGSNIVGTALGGSGTNTVTLQGSGTASNAFVNFQTLTMQGDDWAFSGTGTFASADLQSGTLNLTGTLGDATAVNVRAPATLNMQGVSQTFGTVTNAGTIMTGGNGTTTLATSNFVGVPGSELVLNAVVGADSSPSDKLVADSGSGTTSIIINNLGGSGAMTSGNGILVVQATAATSTVFDLDEPLRPGAFDYSLVKGGLDGTDPNDWFLRSAFVAPPQPPPQPPPGRPEPPEVPPGTIVNPPEPGRGDPQEIPPTVVVVPPGEGPPGLPADPPPSPLPPGQLFPIIGPEIATYGVVQPVARQMGLAMLGTFHERVGDAADDAACLSAPDLVTKESGLITKASGYETCQQQHHAVWGRVFGDQVNDHYQAFADPRASGQVAGIQSGIDLWRGSLIPGHTDVAGVYFGYGNASVSVDGLVTNPALTAYILEHTGAVNLNAFSAGGYFTHRGPTGWYIDAVLQGSFYNGNAATQRASLPVNGTGLVTSLEAGYPILLPVLGPGFVLEPEGQIIWQQVSFDEANDGLGPVGLGTTSGATGRLGLRGKWTISDPAGRVYQPYVVANVWRDFGSSATTLFGIDSVPLLEQATRLELAAGLSARILTGLTLYAQAGYQFAVSGTDGGTRDGVRGDFGVHFAW